MRAGQVPDPIYGQRSKQRSVHHNYFTLSVLFIMISNHYASTYAQQHGWAGLALISVAAVSIRHFFNRSHKGVNQHGVVPASCRSEIQRRGPTTNAQSSGPGSPVVPR